MGPMEENRSKSVIIVDDDAAIRRMLTRLLEKRFEWVVIGEAADGFEALRRLETFTPDLILMDIEMPGMNGIVATAEIKKKHPDLPIVALTGRGDQETVAQMLKV